MRTSKLSQEQRDALKATALLRSQGYVSQETRERIDDDIMRVPSAAYRCRGCGRRLTWNVPHECLGYGGLSVVYALDPIAIPEELYRECRCGHTVEYHHEPIPVAECWGDPDYPGAVALHACDNDHDLNESCECLGYIEASPEEMDLNDAHRALRHGTMTGGV